MEISIYALWGYIKKEKSVLRLKSVNFSGWREGGEWGVTADRYKDVLGWGDEML